MRRTHPHEGSELAAKSRHTVKFFTSERIACVSVFQHHVVRRSTAVLGDDAVASRQQRDLPVHVNLMLHSIFL